MTSIVWAPETDDEANHKLAEWIEAHIWGAAGIISRPCRCFGVFRGKRLLGAVAFHDWQPEYGVVWFSGAAIDASWLSREVIREIADHGFDRLGCQLLAIRVDPDNARVIRIFRALGFQSYAIPRLRGRDKADLIMTLTVETRDASPFIRRR